MQRMTFYPKLTFCLCLFLVGCLNINDVPVTRLYVIDTTNQICSERIVTDKKTLASKRVQELPLSQCNGNVSLTMQEFLNLRTYLKENK